MVYTTVPLQEKVGVQLRTLTVKVKCAVAEEVLIRDLRENVNQMKPDLEEVFLNDSQVGSVMERDHLKSLSIMKLHPKAYLVLNQKPRERTH